MHSAVIESVSRGQVFEDVVIGSERGGGEGGCEDGVGCVVERVGGHEGTAVNVAGQDELDLSDPLLDGLRFRLGPLVILFEVVRVVPVQIEPSGVVSERGMETLYERRGNFCEIVVCCQTTRY